MKIVFIGGRDIHEIGGIENYMLNLATQLVAMGHEPIVFCESNKNKKELVNGFKVIYLKGLKSNLLCKPWVALKATLYTIFKEKNVDFIHYNAWPPSLWSPLAGLFGITTLMQGHGLEWQRSKYSPLQQKIMKFMECYTAYVNRHLIMCSHDQTLYFKKTYNRTATTIPTAINLPDSNMPQDLSILNRFGLVKKKYFLFLARLVQDKNPDYLIKAFKKAKTEDYTLVIAGNNPADENYVKYLQKIAEDCNNIILTGPVYGIDKEMLLQNAYAFCIPSTIEGLSISLLEAMSRKIPIIASSISANQEVLAKKNSMWVSPENEQDLIYAIEYAITHEYELQSTIEPNFEIVISQYTWKNVAQKYINYLLSIQKK